MAQGALCILFVIPLAASLLAGCSATLSRSALIDNQRTTFTPRDAREARLFDELLAQLAAWYSTPYEWGGLDRDGIDCSGFVYRTYRERFDISLPRTTRAQARLGVPVPRGALRAGDLVFFHTTPDTRHVGIALGNGRFLHASTTLGVTTSRLDNPYWHAHYWKALRPSGLTLEPDTGAKDWPK